MAKHSEGTRSRAIELYREHGLAHAARETGVAKSTISGWITEDDRTHAERSAANTERATAANVRRWDQRRIEIKHRLGDVAEAGVALAETALNIGDARSARDAMTTAAIAIDKAEVLSVHIDAEAREAQGQTIEAKVAAVRGRGLTLLPGGQAEGVA